MARSVPEFLTVRLAGLLDLMPLDRLFGDPLQRLLAVTPLTPAEFRRLDGSEDDGSLEDEQPEVRQRYQSSLIWQGLGWTWFVLACLFPAVFFLFGNSPLRPGPARTFVFPVVMLATAGSLGNSVVCLGIGKGRTILGRSGGGNVVWLLVAVPFWALFMALLGVG